MTAKKALLVGFDDRFVDALRDEGFETVARIASGSPSAENEYTFISAKDYARFTGTSETGPLVSDHVRDAAHELVYDSFARCADRYANSSAMLNDYTDFELLFDLALVQARNLLDRFAPDVLVFVNVPHRGATLALYAYARATGVHTVVCLQSLFADRLWIVDDWRDLGLFDSSRRGEPFEIDHTPPQKMPFYMKRIDSPAKKMVRALLRYAEFNLRLLPTPLQIGGKNGPKRVNRVLDELRNAVQMVRYPGFRRSAPQCIRTELRGDFVYFPLHMQPEMTTDVLGGVFANQIRALHKLRNLVPDDIPIIVKENPKQTGLMRSPMFWRAVRSIPNLAFVEDHASSLELVRYAKLTATVTGTAGWEALCCGKPALAYGDVFWRQLPGAFHDADNPTWEEIDSFAFDRPALAEGVSEMSRYGYEGVADLDYAEIAEDFSPGPNAIKLARSVAEHIARSPTN